MQLISDRLSHHELIQIAWVTYLVANHWILMLTIPMHLLENKNGES